MSAQSNGAGGAFTFQVAQSELGPLFVDMLKLDGDSGSPVAAPLGRYKKGSSKKPSAELKAVAADADAARAAAILARPEWTMTNRTGGGSLPLSFFTAAHAPSIDEYGVAVVAPSYDGAYFIQLFASPWLFLAWWLNLNASGAAEPIANYIPPSTSYESLIYLLHTTDLYRRASMNSQLDHQPTEMPSITAESFGATFKTSVRSNDLRWLLPAFLGLTPGLDRAGFDEAGEHLKALARLEFLFPAKSGEDGDTNDRLVFGEAGRIMGVEFYRSWFQAVGFETSVRTGGGWRVADRGFLAPTGLANHLVLVDLHQAGSGSPSVNHQAMTRDVLDGKMARLLTQSLAQSLLSPDEESETATQNCEQCDLPLKPGQKFCVNCGAAVAPQDVNEESTYCTHCGATLLIGKMFCADCGTRA